MLPAGELDVARLVVQQHQQAGGAEQANQAN